MSHVGLSSLSSSPLYTPHFRPLDPCAFPPAPLRPQQRRPRRSAQRDRARRRAAPRPAALEGAETIVKREEASAWELQRHRLSVVGPKPLGGVGQAVGDHLLVCFNRFWKGFGWKVQYSCHSSVFDHQCERAAVSRVASFILQPKFVWSLIKPTEFRTI